MKHLLTIAISLLSASSFAASHCVREAASGDNDGTDWDNAYTELPASLTRGDTYYVADGTYDSYTLDDNESGTAVITIKKATAADHGPATGWSAGYGGQAVWNSLFRIKRSNVVFDGVYRNESDWFDGDAYGFKIQEQGNWVHLETGHESTPMSNITVNCLFIAAQVGVLPVQGSGNTPYAIMNVGDNALMNRGYVFRRVYVLGSNNPFFVRQTISPVIEYCASWGAVGSAVFHGEIVNGFYLYYGGPTVRYCHFRDAYNGALGGEEGGGTGVIALAEVANAYIYGNIVERYFAGNGFVAAGWDNDNIKVFNNTITGGGANTPTVHFPNPDNGKTGTGNEAYNNINIDCVQVSYSGVGTFAYNSTLGTTSLVSYATSDFRLAMATVAGTNLGATFSSDLLGYTRGWDGVWDRGAFEFGYPDTVSTVNRLIIDGTLRFGQ
jgi:hypothetical protein